MPFSRVLYIERDDFREDPPKKFFRLSPGKEVRLRCAYFITCTEVVKDERGEIVELRCTYDPATRGGDAPDGRRVKATLHWVSAAHAVPVEVRLYDRLFSVEDPENVPDGKTFLDHLNPHSLEVLRDCQAEPSLAPAAPGDARPVRAARLLLRRSRLTPGRARLQPHGLAARHVGEDCSSKMKKVSTFRLPRGKSRANAPNAGGRYTELLLHLCRSWTHGTAGKLFRQG